MKIKKGYILNLSVILIIFLCIGMVQSIGSSEDEVKKAMSTRIEILNDFYTGNDNFEVSSDKLKKIEKSSLLKDDITLMKGFDVSDMDTVQSHDVTITSIDESKYGMITGEARINWTIISYTGVIKETYDYYFAGEAEDIGIKLTRLKKI